MMSISSVCVCHASSVSMLCRARVSPSYLCLPSLVAHSGIAVDIGGLFSIFIDAKIADTNLDCIQSLLFCELSLYLNHFPAPCQHLGNG